MLYTRTPFKFIGLCHTMLPTTNNLPPSVKDRNIAMNWLLDQFPKAFNLGNRQPLKADILSDIIAAQQANTPSQAALRDALSYYKEWGSYLNGIKAGAKRINLYGEAVNDVSQIEEDKAQTTLRAAQQKCT